MSAFYLGDVNLLSDKIEISLFGRMLDLGNEI
jgi:hypothetical protein